MNFDGNVIFLAKKEKLRKNQQLILPNEQKEGEKMSERLKCTVTSCVYNRSQHCGATDIKVQGQRITNSSHDTCCGSYILQGTPKATARLCAPTEFKSGVTQLTDNEGMKPMVYCAVENCRYYEKGCCEAVEVEIENQQQGGTYETMCHTFQMQA